MMITPGMAFLLLVWHSQYGKAQKWNLILLCGLVWTVIQYKSWLPHSAKFGISGYFRAQYYFSLLAKLHELIAELPAGEACIVCHL